MIANVNLFQRKGTKVAKTETKSVHISKVSEGDTVVIDKVRYTVAVITHGRTHQVVLHPADGGTVTRHFRDFAPAEKGKEAKPQMIQVVG